MASLDIIKEIAKNDTDISDHLETIYLSSMSIQPKLIVELGVRGGESTRVFNYVNKDINSRLISVDIENCNYNNITNGTFYQMDDVLFGKLFKFTTTDPIDVLFIDTSHLYDHTKQEIETWFNLLNYKALVIFHDTNLKPTYYHRNGNYCTNAWDNQRGVIRAIEEYFSINVDESQNFELIINKNNDRWYIKHEYICNGLTLCYKNSI